MFILSFKQHYEVSTVIPILKAEKLICHRLKQKTMLAAHTQVGFWTPWPGIPGPSHCTLNCIFSFTLHDSSVGTTRMWRVSLCLSSSGTSLLWDSKSIGYVGKVVCPLFQNTLPTLGPGPTFHPGVLMAIPDRWDFFLGLNYWRTVPQMGKPVQSWSHLFCPSSHLVLSLKSVLFLNDSSLCLLP